jgi:hypothetical protein
MPPFGNSATANGGAAVNNTGPGDVNINIGDPNRLASILTPLLVKIIETHKPTYKPGDIYIRDPGVDEKIAFNNVRLLSGRIRENCGLMSIIEQALNSIDSESPYSREAFLWAIHKKYDDVKIEMLLEAELFDQEEIIAFIRNNADKMLKKVSDMIFLDAGNGIDNFKEYIQAAQDLVVCYGFINCQILEAPQ